MAHTHCTETAENLTCTTWGRGWAHFVPNLVLVTFVLLMTGASISSLQWSLQGLLSWALGWAVASAAWWGASRNWPQSWPLAGYSILTSLAAAALWGMQPAFGVLALALWLSASAMLLWGCATFPKLRKTGVLLAVAHVLLGLLAVALLGQDFQRGSLLYPVAAFVLTLACHAGLAAIAAHCQTLQSSQHIAQLEQECAELQLQTQKQRTEADPLTGAESLPRITEFINQLRERHARKEETFCVAMVEMDPWVQREVLAGNIKGVSLEQQVQMMLGGLLSSQIRSVDRLGRNGSESFLLVLSDTSSMQAIWVLHRIRASMRYGEWQGVMTLGKSINHHPTLTIAVAEYAAGETAEQLLSRADMALQHGRSLGQDQIVIAEDLNF